ncbi:acid-sensing ion channel 2 [Nematostella vectensis]|uniref:acid-sensing ion channel 2 n=1 Tax=Nematostella vectensis TaxID=45351 RepID=UPI0020776B27|nr:acid-sensing ion channel 2 [Nematostella vectensis]
MISAMKETWREFASNTTLHGLRYAVGVCDIRRRSLWILCLLACAASYLYMVIISFGTYIDRPIRTEVSHEFPKDGLDFPVVTICNLNYFVKSKIDTGYEDEAFFTRNLNMSVCGIIRGVSGNLTCGQALLCAYETFGSSVVDGCDDVIRSRVIAAVNSSNRPFDTEEFMTRYGHDFAPMLMGYCAFSVNENCDINDWSPHITPGGMCYTFSKANQRKVYFLGGEGGLSIILDAQISEHTFGDFSTGFRVILSARGTYINRARGFNVFPGSHALVAVTPKKFERLPAPYRTNCSDRFLPGYGKYTKDACYTQCINNATMTDCGCRLPSQHAKFNNLPKCSIQDQECRAAASVRVRSTLCDCTVPCKEQIYEPRVSYSKFPDITITKILTNHFKLNKSASYLRDSLVFLQIGFEELAYQVDRQAPSYGPGNLFGDLGGNMGLMLGCSILTLIEFIDFLWIALKSSLNKSKRTATNDCGFSQGTGTSNQDANNVGLDMHVKT